MIVAVVCALLAITPAPTPATSFDDATQRALHANVDDVIADTAMGTQAGFTMAVSDHGRQWRYSRGTVDAAKKQPATTSTSFRLASITKSFTAIAVMQLVQDGELFLETPARTIVPALPESSSTITIRQLLNHTSGIRHYPLKGPERAWKKHLTTAQALDVFVDRPLAFPPGQSFLYTTYGYDVLGAVLEAHTKTAYADVVDERIFAPLGMTQTFIEDSRKRDKRWPVGLKQNKKGDVVRGDVIDVSSRFAGGGARGTVDDLLRYAEALLAGHLVDDDTWRQITKPTFTDDGLQNDYGFGFAVYPQRGHLVVAHAGGQPETTSLVYLVPAEQLAVVMLTNLEGQGNLQQDVAAAVVETLREDGQPRRGVYAVDPVDHVFADGLNRAFTHGRAFVDQVAADITVDAAAVERAFERFSTLTRTIDDDPFGRQQQLREAHHPKSGRTSTLVGATLARKLREASPSTWASLPKRGALAFFADAQAMCLRKESRCEPWWFPSSAPTRVDRLLVSLTSWASTTAAAWHRRDLEDVERVKPVLQQLLTQPVRPDLHEDLVVVADRLQRRGRLADAEALRALDLQLYPQPMPAPPPSATGTPPHKTAP